MASSRISLALGLLCLIGYGCMSTDAQDGKTTGPATPAGSTVPPSTTGATPTTSAPHQSSTAADTSTKEPPTTQTGSTTAVETSATSSHHEGTTAPPTTSSHHESTSERPNTTPETSPTVPTPSPASHNLTLNTYKVSDGSNKTCLMVKMKIQFETSKAAKVNVSEDARVNKEESSCLKLTVGFGDNKNSFTLDFKTDNKNGSFFLETIVANVAGVSGNLTGQQIGKASIKASYKCDAGYKWRLSNNINMTATDVQFQAYEVDNDKFGTAQICSSDEPSNIIIPIAVGCALGGLIIIVLIAYLIGRRRMQQRYQAI